MQEIIAMVLVATVTSFFLKRARNPAKFIPADNAVVLEYPKRFSLAVVGFVSALPSAIFLWVLTQTGLHSRGDVWGYISVVTFFICVGIVIYAAAAKEKIMAAPEGVFADALFLAPRAFEWSDISGVRYSTVRRRLILESKDKRKIKISRLMWGFSDFCAYVSRYLPDEAFQHELRKAMNDQRVV